MARHKVKSIRIKLRRKVYQLKVRNQKMQCASRGLMVTACWNPRNSSPCSPVLIWKD
jgi:hypothetical protein